MAILFVAADAAELQPFERYLINARKLKWPLDYAYEGILEGRRILLAANGAGPKLVAQAIEVAKRAITAAELSSSKLEAIVSVGFCGAYTTFSTMQIEVLRMVDRQRWELATGYALCSLLAGYLAIVAGTALTRGTWRRP